MNDEYMYRGQKVKRDQYIRLLVDNERMTLKEVASRVDLDKSSVSRIYNGTQNLSGTGKGGPQGHRRRAGVVPLDYGPFMKAAKSIIATMDSKDGRVLSWTLPTDAQVTSLLKRLCQTTTQLLNEQDQYRKSLVARRKRRI